MPPQRDTHGHAAAAVVPSWSSDFNVDQVAPLPVLSSQCMKEWCDRLWYETDEVGLTRGTCPTW